MVYLRTLFPEESNISITRYIRTWKAFAEEWSLHTDITPPLVLAIAHFKAQSKIARRMRYSSSWQ